MPDTHSTEEQGRAEAVNQYCEEVAATLERGEGRRLPS